MRKLISVTFALLLLISVPLTACATEIPAESDETNEENTVKVTSSSGTKEITPITISPENVKNAQSSAWVASRAGTRIEFAGAEPIDVIIGSSSVVVSTGETVALTVDPCVWAPEHYNLYIGFWNENTAKFYPEEISGGNICDTFYYTGMPAGTYRVAIMNLGSTSLTTGYMLYTLSYPVG